MIRMLVGLGNPGTEYEGTRHNAGFWWVDEAARVLGARLMHDRAYHGLVARVNRPDGPVWLIEPQTYMNLSGKSVAPLARFFKIEPSEILVVHDELDLPPGQMKIKQGGGAAGHNGLKDIHAQLGTADFWRLRIGIGHPRDSAMPAQAVVDYVLKPPRAEEADAIERAIDRALAAWPAIAAGDMSRATQALHTREAKAAQRPVEAKTVESKVAKP
jgi:PTH1 family peptidyl-tRNA hydrolase